MQTQAMVSRLLRCCAPLMHAARWQVLNDVTLSALCGRPLTLAEIYTLAEGLAKPWEADAVPVRIDHLVTALPQPNGSSTDWSVSFYLAAAKGGMQIDTGDGKLYCSTYRGEPAGYIPALRPDLTRDGAALYTLAEKHGQALLGKGYGMRHLSVGRQRNPSCDVACQIHQTRWQRVRCAPGCRCQYRGARRHRKALNRPVCDRAKNLITRNACARPITPFRATDAERPCAALSKLADP